MDDIESIKSGSAVTVSGQLVDAKGKGFYGTVKLEINDGKATVKTDNDGYFTYNTTLSKVGTTNITASYVESAKYTASSTSASVEVLKLNTSIALDNIKSVKVGEKITISGKLTDENGNVVVGTIKLLINNGRATVKTDDKGVFSYVYTTTKSGVNNISASYLGANRYTESSANTTVNLIAVKTVISLDKIPETKKGETITISGKLLDENGKAVANSGVKLLINGGRKTVKTDSKGVFTYNYTVNKVGQNNITATFLANNKYDTSNTTTTVTVAKLGTKIVINPIKTVAQKATVDITGKLSDENGKGIYGTVKLLINSGRATVKTDNSGVFTYTHTASRVGTNNVTADYVESENYKASQSTATFTVTKA